MLSPALEVSFPDPSIALKFGYTESKWIAERILIAANQKTGLHSTTVRVGFLCGDRNGTWAPNEMYPQVIKSAIALKCLPDVQGVSTNLRTQEFKAYFAALL